MYLIFLNVGLVFYITNLLFKINIKWLNIIYIKLSKYKVFILNTPSNQTLLRKFKGLYITA